MTRRIVISALLVVGLLTTVFGQTEDSKIRQIRDKFRIINTETGYQTKTLTNEQFLENMTDNGGELTGYFKKGQIMKITERVGISYCIRTFDYYFWSGELIFVYEKEEDFPYVDSTASFDYTTLELAFEGRYYFDKGKLIDTKLTGKKRIPDDREIDFEQELLVEAKHNIRLLTKENRVR